MQVIPQTSTQENLHTGYPCRCDAQKLGLNSIISVPAMQRSCPMLTVNRRIPLLRTNPSAQETLL